MAPTILAWEQRLAAQHLGQNTANRPHVNRLCVLLERKHNLRRTIPSRCNIFGHEARVVFGRGCRSGETKVADLQIAIGVEEQIGGLEIAMKDICRVHGL